MSVDTDVWNRSAMAVSVSPGFTVYARAGVVVVVVEAMVVTDVVVVDEPVACPPLFPPPPQAEPSTAKEPTMTRARSVEVDGTGEC
jgi:hypothetical protein